MTLFPSCCAVAIILCREAKYRICSIGQGPGPFPEPNSCENNQSKRSNSITRSWFTLHHSHMNRTLVWKLGGFERLSYCHDFFSAPATSERMKCKHGRLLYRSVDIIVIEIAKKLALLWSMFLLYPCPSSHPWTQIIKKDYLI